MGSDIFGPTGLLHKRKDSTPNYKFSSKNISQIPYRESLICMYLKSTLQLEINPNFVPRS